MVEKKPRKQQERTAVTRELLLRGAEQVFSAGGYEKARLEEIAAAAGFSKGALFAHFKTKEALFLALYESKNAEVQTVLSQALNGAETREEKIAAFRSNYVELSKQKAWALIVLEMKLYIIRYPEVKERLLEIDERIGNGIEAVLVELFGKTSRPAGEALGGIWAALALEAQLAPDLISERKSKQMLGTVFDALLGIS